MAAVTLAAGSVAWVATAQAATAGPGFGCLWLDGAVRPRAAVPAPPASASTWCGKRPGPGCRCSAARPPVPGSRARSRSPRAGSRR